MKFNKYIITATILYIGSMIIPVPTEDGLLFGFEIAKDGLAMFTGNFLFKSYLWGFFFNLPNFAFIANIILVIAKHPGSFWAQLLGCLSAIYWIPDQLIKTNWSFFTNPLYFMWLVSMIYLLIGILKRKEIFLQTEHSTNA